MSARKKLVATSNQIQFVADIEAGAKALLSSGKKPEAVTAGELCIMGGRYYDELKPIVSRLGLNMQGPLLDRLLVAFRSVGCQFEYLEQVISKLNEDKPMETTNQDLQTPVLKLETRIPAPGEAQTDRKSQNAKTALAIYKQVLDLLEPLDQGVQRRIIAGASEWLGVGS